MMERPKRHRLRGLCAEDESRASSLALQLSRKDSGERCLPDAGRPDEDDAARPVT
jgi:hypothetical protein